MSKLIILVLVFFFAYWLLKTYKRKVDGKPRWPSQSKAGEDMVRCDHCGVHLPRSESVMSGQLFYCSPDHRRLHEKP